MAIKKVLFLMGTFLFLSSSVYADAPLEKELGLDMDKSKQTQEIQKKYRKEFSSKRGELHREERKLRRAKKANDSNAVAEIEPVVASLQGELQQIRANENNEIRGVLNQDQLAQFEEILIKRGEMAGSSRDVKEY